MLTAILALLLIAVGTVWLLPRILDASQHRDVIERLAARALGRSVRIEGPVALSLLPEPSLVAANVTVGDDDPHGPQITARELRLRIGLLPLLSGHLNARDLVLSGADIRLPDPKSFGPTDAGLLTMRPPEWLSGLSARIEAGKVHFGALLLSDVNVTVQSDAETGSYTIDGTLRVAGRLTERAAPAKPDGWHITAKLLRGGPDGAVGLDVAIDGRGPAAGTEVGLIAQVAENGSSSGQLTARGPNLAQLGPAPNLPFQLTGRFSLGDGLAAVDTIEGTLGGSPVRGAVSLRLSPRPRLDVAIGVTRLDLDGWMQTLPALLSNSLGNDLTFGLDVSAEAAPLADGMLRQLHLALDMNETGTILREARAIVPGEASIALAGKILPPNPDFADSPRFVGTIELAAPDLRTSLDWASAAGLPILRRLPPGVLRTATLAGSLTLTPTSATLSALRGRIDNAVATGDIAIHVATGDIALYLATRPAIAAHLNLDHLTLDPWVADWWAAPWPQVESLGGLAAGLDLDLAITAAKARLHGNQLAPFALQLARSRGRLALSKLSFEIGGVQVATSGAWLEGKRLADGKLELRTADLSNLEGALPALPPALAPWLRPLLRGAGNLSLVASGPVAALALRLTGDLGDLRFDLQPLLNIPALSWRGRLALRHPGAPRLAAQLGLPGAQAWLGDGSFSLAAQLSGTPSAIICDYFDLGAGGLRASGQLGLKPGDAPVLSGRIAAETLPLPPAHRRTTEPLPLGWLVGWQADVALSAGEISRAGISLLDHLTGRLTLVNGQAGLRDLAAGFAGGRLTGNLNLDTVVEPPRVQLDATLAAALISHPLWNTPVDIRGALVDGKIALEAAGHTPGALLASLSGNADLVLREGTLNGLALADLAGTLTDAKARAALSAGTTAFDRLVLGLSIDHGVVTVGQSALTAPAGHIQASGQLDLTSGRVDLRLGLRPAMPDSPEIGLRLNGITPALARTPELSALIRWRAEHPPPH